MLYNFVSNKKLHSQGSLMTTRQHNSSFSKPACVFSSVCWIINDFIGVEDYKPFGAGINFFISAHPVY